MTYPFKVPKEPPYTEVSQVGLNTERAKRTVYCQYYKYSIVVNLYGAKCGQCKSFLINLSGNNELVK